MENVAHVEESINPQRDVEILERELIAKDLETIEKNSKTIEKNLGKY